MRIHIIGCTGAGKSSLARQIALRHGLPHVELDVLHWEPGWTAAPAPVFHDRLVRALEAPAWVVDGSYLHVRDLIWAKADTILWLDYPFWLLLVRLTVRTFWRLVRKETICNGNSERLSVHLFTRDSLFWWLLTTYHQRRRDYSRLLPQYPHLDVHRFRSPRQTTRWLDSCRVQPESQET